MKIAARRILLSALLALGSFALGAVSVAKPSTAPAAAGIVQPLPVSGSDASVPLASMVSFPADERAFAPTF
jgi:hypothetical protein